MLHENDPGSSFKRARQRADSAWRHRRRLDPLRLLSVIVEGTQDDRMLVERLDTMLREAPHVVGALRSMRLPRQTARQVWAWVERCAALGRLGELAADDRAWLEVIVEARLNARRFKAHFRQHLERLKLNHRGELAARLIVIGVPPALERFLRRELARLAPHEREPFAAFDLACNDVHESLDDGDLPAAARSLRELTHWAHFHPWSRKPVDEVLRRAAAYVRLRQPARDLRRVVQRHWRAPSVGGSGGVDEASLTTVLRRARRSPSDLLAQRDLAFWAEPVPSRHRATLRAAAHRFIRQVPATSALPAFLRGAQLNEVRTWVKYVQFPTRAETLAAHAQLFVAAGSAHGARGAPFFLEAERRFSRVPRAERMAWPRLWLELESLRGDEHVLSALRDIGVGLIALGRYSEHFFPGPELSEAVRERARPILDELTLATPRRFIRPHDRLRALERHLLRTLAERPRHCRPLFEAFVDDLAFESFPGNFLRLLRAVIAQGLERDLCRRALTIAMEAEWREWVRPDLVALLRAFDRAERGHIKARSGRRRRR
ncbi:MAG: hypothetical protein MUC96_13135 [Myxococcaceae bacterium]|jgi:hypothetical protein|nr:hypothetical protein [Myxococcaceae bacterium]